MKLDILAIGAHPDDVELSCAGTLLAAKASGKKIGVVDLTRGELGTRGSAKIRDQESKAAAKILKLDARENLGLRDGFFQKDESSLLKVITIIRKYRPEVVLCNAEFDRHIDHARGGDLVHDACFLSGLRKIETRDQKKTQEAWRPRAVYHYQQDYFVQPHLVIDITPFMETKMKSVKAYSSQFYDPKSKEPQTAISGKDYFDHLYGRALQCGRYIGVQYGEGFTVKRPIGSNDILTLF